MATWPTADSFPQTPLMSFNQVTAPNTVLTTDMDAGPPKTRQRSTAGYYIHDYVFGMTATNLSALLTFYNTTTNGGADSFEWTHPRTSTTEDWVFVNPPSWRQVAPDRYEVNVTLRELPD